MSSNKNDQNFDPDDRRKHLEFIQAVIARLAGASAAAKAASLTLATAAFGFSAINKNWYLSVLGLVVILAFSTLDGHYLHEERLYRDLYQDVVEGKAPSFSMNNRLRSTTRRRAHAYRSWSLIRFYLPLIAVGLCATVISLASGA